MTYYIHTDIKGTYTLPPDIEFHHWCFKGTKEEYYKVLDEIFGEFWEKDGAKVLGSHYFETFEELNKKYNLPRIYKEKLKL